VEQQIGSETVKFGKLSPLDRAKLLRQYKMAQREDLKSSLTDSGLPAEQAYIEYRTFDSQIWGAVKWVQYVNESDGAAEVLRASLLKHYEPAHVDKILDKFVLSETDELRLLCDVSRLAFREPSPTVPNMVQVGVLNGQPVYQRTENAADSEGAGPNAPTPAPKTSGYGS